VHIKSHWASDSIPGTQIKLNVGGGNFCNYAFLGKIAILMYVRKTTEMCGINVVKNNTVPLAQEYKLSYWAYSGQSVMDIHQAVMV
jgi:hypothetical protein